MRLKTSRASFQALAGTNYSIVVAGKIDADPAFVGNFQLRWHPTPPPILATAQFAPANGLPGTTVTLTGTNFSGATNVLFNGAAATFTNASGNNLDLRIIATVPRDASTGLITVVTPHGTVTSTLAFTLQPPPLSISIYHGTDGIKPNRVQVSWAATSDSLVLESSDDLAPPIWAPLTENRVVEEKVRTSHVITVLGPRFFRLRHR